MSIRTSIRKPPFAATILILLRTCRSWLKVSASRINGLDLERTISGTLGASPPHLLHFLLLCLIGLLHNFAVIPCITNVITTYL